MMTVEFFDEISVAIEEKMRQDLIRYEKSCGIDVNYKKFSLILRDDNKEVIGVLNAFTAFSEIYIDDMWVETSSRGKGYGKKLIDSLLQHFEGKGFNNINLCTSAFQAPEFYKKCGFKLEFIRENKQNPKLTKFFFVRFFKNQIQNQGVAKKNSQPDIQLINEQSRIIIKQMAESDISVVASKFAEVNWLKPASTFELYLQEQRLGTRLIWIAHLDNQFAGYVTLKWQSQYERFATAKIPEIMDLNVLPSFRKFGVGSKLLDSAESEASTRSDIVGIGVGLYGGPDGGYGVAQKLYVNRGYVPDGKGVTYHYKSAIPGSAYPLDDDLVLWFIKKLR